MKVLIFVGLFALLLFFGCTQPQPPAVTGTPISGTTATPSTVVQATSTPAGPTGPAGECAKADLKFGDVTIPELVVYGSSNDISAEVLFDKGTCQTVPSSAMVELYDGKRKLASVAIAALLDKNPVKLKFKPETTRKYNLLLRILGTGAEEADAANNDHLFSITADPYGFSDVSGNLKFDINSVALRSQAFELKESRDIKEIQLYLRKSATGYEIFDVYAEIRPDAAGKPSGSNTLSLTTGYSTLPPEWGWVKFSANRKTTLQPGIYWLVVRSLSMQPPVQLHAVANTTFGKPEFSMRSDGAAPNLESWKTHSEGVFNFRFTNDEPEPLADYSQTSSPRPKPSSDFDPYSAV